MSNEIPTTWLTIGQRDHLQAEYEERTGPLRTMITKRIEAAREEGDLKENGGYHAAKDEQGKNEARVRVLRHLLDHAKIAEPTDNGIVQPGTLVTIKFAGDDDTETFMLGSREGAETVDLQVYSPGSPLGGAVMGAEQGSTITYAMPNGRTTSVEIIGVELYKA